MSNTKFNKVDVDWVNVKNKCRTTVNKQHTENKVSEDFKNKLLISEHSPIRLIKVDWMWEDIKSWIATHWSRHKWECFISTQRDDRTGINRDDEPQGKVVNFEGEANAQNLIDTWRKRLCFQSHPQTRALAEDFKRELFKFEPRLSDVLVPNCVYRGGCPEMQQCGYWENFRHLFKEDLWDIEARYLCYNEYFWKPYLEV